VAGCPVALSDTPGEITRRPPTLGEHTRDILTEIGYGEAEIAELSAQRVV